jgi:pyrimidine operon attenuation protein/uracil phosphoribosyltransferase
MLLNKITADKKIKRMALEINERNHDQQEILLVGIKSNGVIIAAKIADYLKSYFAGTVHLIELSMDKKQPGEITLSEPVNFNGQTVVLIDDVANSGSTMLYALKPMLSDHPRKIETLVLLERTHKRFPVDVSYVGLSVATASDEYIEVTVDAQEVSGAFLRKFAG